MADSPEEEIDYGIDANLVAQKPRHKKKASLASMDKEEDRASTYSHPSMVESANKRVPSSIASNASDDHGYTPSPDTAEVSSHNYYNKITLFRLLYAVLVTPNEN